MDLPYAIHAPTLVPTSSGHSDKIMCTVNSGLAEISLGKTVRNCIAIALAITDSRYYGQCEDYYSSTLVTMGTLEVFFSNCNTKVN